MTDFSPVVVGIGEILWDMLPSGKRAGGAPINFVYHAAKMGAEGYAISAIGNDVLGREIIRELKKNHITHIITTNNYPTGRVEVELKNGIPSYKIIEGVAWDHIRVTPQAIDVMRRADAICFGTLALRNAGSRDSIKKLLSFARPRAIKFFDINLRGNYYSLSLIDELLQLATVFKINDDEIKIIRELFGINGSDDEVCREFIRRYNLDYLIFTAGEKYSVVYTKDDKSYLATPKVEVCDTVGAGDAFSGAFTYNILAGKSLREAHAEAVKISAYVCTKAGAWPEYNLLPKG